MKREINIIAATIGIAAIAPATGCIGAFDNGAGGSGGEGGTADAGGGAGDGDAMDHPQSGDGGTDVTYSFSFYAATTQGLQSFSIDPETLLLSDHKDVGQQLSLALAVDPAGRYVFTSEGQSGVTYTYRSYSIDGTTGDVTPAGSLASVHRFPYVMAVDPTGTLLFTGDTDTRKVTSYAIDQTTGKLTFVSDVTADVSASSYNEMRVHPDGRHLYLGSFSASSELRTINVAAGGALTMGPAIPDASIGDVHVDSAGRFLYSGPAFGDTAIRSYRIDAATGALTPLGPIDTGGSITRIVTDPAGRFLYAGRGSGQVVVYSIAPGGTLTYVSELPLTDPGGAAASLFSLTFHPGGRALYAHSRRVGGDTIHTLAVDPVSGALTNAGPVVQLVGAAYLIRTARTVVP